MKVVFAGPSLHGAAVDWEGIVSRPPAAQGDLFAAVEQGATAIGLIDGLFGATASVWHKEILFALRLGVRLVGGASMGALRAAECRSFGMEPVGRIALGYATGSIDDDSLVALTHGPAELGYAPFTVALVDMLATFDRMQAERAVEAAVADRLRAAARETFFEQRTVDEVLHRAGFAEREEIARAYEALVVGVKQQDALQVVERVRALPGRRGPVQTWRMETPPTWRAFVAARQSTTP